MSNPEPCFDCSMDISHSVIILMHKFRDRTVFIAYLIIFSQMKLTNIIQCVLFITITNDVIINLQLPILDVTLEFNSNLQQTGLLLKTGLECQVGLN